MRCVNDQNFRVLEGLGHYHSRVQAKPIACIRITSIAGGFANKFGLRPVCISGSIILCTALCLSTICPNMPLLTMTLGFIGGVGGGLIYLPANVAINYYFEKKRALASGISQAGAGVGRFVFAPLILFLEGRCRSVF